MVLPPYKHHTLAWPAVDYSAKACSLDGHQLREGDWLSLNGSTGEVLRGTLPVKAPEMSGELCGGKQA